MTATAATQIFADDFSAYPLCERMDEPSMLAVRGMDGKVGDLDEMRHQRFGHWEQTTLHYAWQSPRIRTFRDCALPWRIVERDGRRWLEQPERFFNAMLKAGDAEWQDYTLSLDLVVCDGPAGPCVRYQTSRQNYWIAFEADQPARLYRRDQDEHVLLGQSSALRIEARRSYHCTVTCEGAHLAVAVDGIAALAVEDHAYARGPVAIRTEGPSRFGNIKVTASAAAEASTAERQARRRARIVHKRERAPAARCIHSIPMPAETSWVHVQDVNDDGRPEFLMAELAVPQLDYIRLARLHVLDWNGKLLWSFGQSIPSQYDMHGDFAFNAGDVDGDGRTEILVTRDFELLILDGATGRIKKQRPTPHTYRGQEDHYERTVGDSIHICNLRGLSAAQDILLKDRYCNLWAFTHDLQPLWHRHLNTGHYPRARDVDGDGRDEIMGGYSFLNARGETRWTVPGGDPLCNRYPGPGHMDAVLLERFGPGADAPLQIAMAASDLGFLLLDADGRLRAQHRIGHAQNLGCARFCPDLPGRQFAVRCAWGNTGILGLFDCEGRPLRIRELANSGVVPVNWLGDGSALLRFSDGLADNAFDILVDLPASTPGGTWVVFDCNGDGVDEVFVRQNDRLLVFGPESVPANPEPAPPRPLTNWNIYGGFYL